MPRITCKHYTSHVFDNKCRLGLFYRDVQRANMPQAFDLAKEAKLLELRMPRYAQDKLGVPCVPDENPNQMHCDRFEPFPDGEPTEEEIDAGIDLLHRGISPCCRASLEETETPSSKRRFCSKCKELVMIIPL